ncbi:YceI family protein [Solirubrobacter sp. CPCC 204708]|uniref:YceI family protein n=1 Tax=Solirubrobacter deserti TaxID=2282478 RepID=A0ABT4RP75_9ACTN|nr:YceI family protein [Solirubrobacter deserti]MBE2315743.1 YceI family protein [Solirubrobacter deserti]MDA0140367.1 YceI family protein [Solirubrobacter deserti]
MATTEATIIPAGTWAVDPAHTTLEFAVKHLGFATIKGRAQVTVGSIDSETIRATVDATSLTTLEPDRDRHLRTPDFFDSDRHPTLTFESTRITTDHGRLAVEGRLTIRGVTQPVVLSGTVTGTGTDPWGGERLGLDLETVIDRRDFGVSWNEALPGGDVLVGNAVRISASVSAVKED